MRVLFDKISGVVLEHFIWVGNMQAGRQAGRLVGGLCDGARIGTWTVACGQAAAGREILDTGVAIVNQTAH